MKSTAPAKQKLPDLLTGLNAEQERAVTFGAGPLLIIAGAGTGKTKVITNRIAWLIEQGKARPEQILALTFTDKAAGEMLDRLYELLPLGQAPTQVSTFHAFGDAIIREYPYEFGLPADCAVMTEAEQVIFLDEHLFELPLDYLRPHGRPAKFMQKIAKAIARAKNEGITPEAYAAWVKEEGRRVATLTGEEKDDAAFDLRIQQEIAAAYAVYEEKKRDRHLIDYGDQVLLPATLLAGNEVVRKRFRKQFKYILVDEYQDTNVIQNMLLTLLAGTNGNLNVVGDDDQSIFAFQGAAIGNILGFEEAHPEAKRVVLVQNYRSTQQILDASYRLINHNPDRLETKDKIDKKLQSNNPPGSAVSLLRTATNDDEADKVAEIIAAKVAAGSTYSDIAILVRTKNLIEPFRQTLAVNDIPALAEGTGRLFDQPEIRMCVNFLRATVDPRDSAALRYLLMSPAYQFPGDDFFRLAEQMRLTHRPLWELLAEPAADWSESARAVAEKIGADLRHFAELAADLDVGRLLYAWLEQTTYLKKIGAEQTAEDAAKVRNIAKLFARLKQFAHTAEDRSAASWIKHFDDIVAIEDESVATESDTDYDAVRILTVHAAKGLEFETVFVAGCAARKFPSDFRRDQVSCDPLLAPHHDAGEGLAQGGKRAVSDKDTHLAEERRLFYVAMTRAKRNLFLTVASDYGTKLAAKPSRFLEEALGDPVTALPPPEMPDQPLRQIAQSRLPLVVPTKYAAPERISLSHTSIKAYRTCPLKYYWEHVIKLRGEPTFTLQYGTLMHQVIQQINLARQHAPHHAGEGHGTQLDLPTILDWYEQAWRQERFISPAHERRVHERGKRTLERFLAEEAERTPATAVEQRFSLPLTGCVVEGKYDRIDQHKGKTTIVDYKTGSIDSADEAAQRAAKDEQLTIYALAFFEQTGALPERVVLNFVDSGIAGVSQRTERQIAKMRETIERVAVGIREGEFTPSRKAHECSPFAECPGHKPIHRTMEKLW